MSFSIENLTMGEVSQIEEITGLSLSELGGENTPKAKFLTALAWMAKRREDSSFTYNQAEALTFAEATAIIGGTEDADPKEAKN